MVKDCIFNSFSMLPLNSSMIKFVSHHRSIRIRYIQNSSLTEVEHITFKFKVLYQRPVCCTSYICTTLNLFRKDKSITIAKNIFITSHSDSCPERHSCGCIKTCNEALWLQISAAH